MHNIILIATGHREQGKFSSKELLKLIGRITPEIIFEEVPPIKFKGVYEGTISDSLETKTIKRYLDKHPIDHFPVDLDVDQLVENNHRRDMQELDMIFGDHSSEYRFLSAQHAFLAERDGLLYLNSFQCEEILERRVLLEKEILRKINLESLSQKHISWLEYNDKREHEMIKNI